MFRLRFVVALLSFPGLALAQGATAQHGGMQHGQHMPDMSHEGHEMNAEPPFPQGPWRGDNPPLLPFRRLSRS